MHYVMLEVLFELEVFLLKIFKVVKVREHSLKILVLLIPCLGCSIKVLFELFLLIVIISGVIIDSIILLVCMLIIRGLNFISNKLIDLLLHLCHLVTDEFWRGSELLDDVFWLHGKTIDLLDFKIHLIYWFLKFFFVI